MVTERQLRYVQLREASKLSNRSALARGKTTDSEETSDASSSKEIYEELYSNIDEQKELIAERKEEARKQKKLLKKGGTVSEKIAAKKYAKATPGYRVKLAEKKKKEKEAIKEIEEYQEKLKEVKEDIEKQESDIKKYEKEGYKIKKNPEGKYQFSKTVKRTVRRTRTTTKPKTSAEQKKYNELTSKINSLKSYISTIKQKRDSAPNDVLRAMYNAQVIGLGRYMDALKKERSKLNTKENAQEQIKKYETVTKMIETISSGDSVLSRVLSKVKVPGSEETAAERLTTVLEKQAQTIKPTTKTYLMASGVTPSYYETTGSITFKPFTSELTGQKYDSKTFTFGKEGQSYQDIVKWIENRPAEVQEMDKSYLASQWTTSTEKTIPEWYKTEIKSQLSSKDVKRYENLGIMDDYIKTSYEQWIGVEPSTTFEDVYYKAVDEEEKEEEIPEEEKKEKIPYVGNIALNIKDVDKKSSILNVPEGVTLATTDDDGQPKYVGGSKLSTGGYIHGSGPMESLPTTWEGAQYKAEHGGGLEGETTWEATERIQKTSGKREGPLKVIPPALDYLGTAWMGFDEKIEPILHEVDITGGGDTPVYVAKGDDYQVIQHGWTPVSIDKEETLQQISGALSSNQDAISNLDYIIRNIKAYPSNYNWYVGEDQKQMSSKEAIQYYQNEKSKLKSSYSELKNIEGTVESIGKKGITVYTKEPGPVEKQMEFMKDYMGGTGEERALGLVEWVSSGMTPRGMAEDPFSIGTTIRAIWDPEGALRKKARIRAAHFDPVFRDLSYEHMNPASQAMGKFWGGAAGFVSIPVTLPQMGVKYATGKGDLTDIFGRVEAGETLILPDVGKSIYEGGVGGKGQGLIGATFSEAFTLGESPAYEQAAQDPWGTFWATAGEIAGAVALGAGAKTLSSKPFQIKHPYISKAYQYYGKYRPASLVKGGAKQIIEGIRRPSITGALRGTISKIPKVQSQLERFTGRTETITQKWTSGTGKITGTVPSRYALFTRKLVEHPVTQKAIEWAQSGSQEAYPTTMWGVKPMIRNLAEVARRSPKILSKFQENAKINFINKLNRIKDAISKYKDVTKNLSEKSPAKDIVSAVEKLYGKRVAKSLSDSLSEGIVTNKDVIQFLEQGRKGFENEITAIEKALEGKLSVSDKIMTRYAHTTPERILMWAEGRIRAPKLSQVIKGRLSRQQPWDFYMGKGQYPTMTEAELLSSFERGGWHTTPGLPKRYTQMETLAQTLDDALRSAKTPKNIDAVLKLGNPVDDITYEALLSDTNLILTGSRAMKLQSKLSLAKIKRFFGKETDIDLLYKGDYNQTGIMSKKIAEELTRRTGKNYTATTEGVVHEGTWTIKTPTGKRIMDITSTQSPSKGILRSTYGPEGIPIEKHITDIGGVSVADPAYLVYNQVDIAALKSIVPKDLAEKAELSILTQTRTKRPDMGVALGETPESSVMLIRGWKEKALERLDPFKYKRDSILGRGTRQTPMNPAQLELFHQSPEAVRWALGLGEEVTYEPSFLGFGWRSKLRGLYDPTKGVLKGKLHEELKQASGLGPAKGPRAAEAYMLKLGDITRRLKMEGERPIPTVSYKGASIYRGGGAAEAERAYLAFQTQMQTGYTPYLGRVVDVFPSPRLRPTSVGGRIAERWGESIGSLTGWRHYTVDIPTGRTIRIYPTIPKYITPSARIGYLKEKKDIVSDVSAQQPVAPKIEAPKVSTYAERHSLGPSDVAKEITRQRRYGMTYRIPYGYKVVSLGARPYEQEKREKKEYKSYYEPYNIERPYKEYKPYQTVRPEPYDYEREGEPYSYEYDYDYTYKPESYEPYEPYPYTYTRPRAVPEPAPPTPIPMDKKEKQKIEKPKETAFKLGYFEKEYEVPDIWKAGTRKPKFKRGAKPIKSFKPATVSSKKPQIKSKGKVAKKPKFFSLTGGM